MAHSKYIAVVGVGYWGKNLVRNFYELGVLQAVCDNDTHTTGALKTQYPDIHIYSNMDEVLASSGIKAVAISTPAVTHFELAKKALMADKDVFVEKPLSTSVRDAEELLALARARNRILMVGHILQYHPAISVLKDFIVRGELGKIQYIYSNRLNIGKLRTEENILWSFAPHDISVILMLIGEEPLEVSAFAGDYLNRGIFDVTLTTLRFKNEVKGHIFVSWLHPFKEQKLIVVGSKAMAVFDDMSEEKLFIYPHKIEWLNGKIPLAHKSEYHTLPVEKKEPLQEELSHFIERVKDRKTPKTDGREGITVLKILEQAERSLQRQSYGS